MGCLIFFKNGQQDQVEGLFSILGYCKEEVSRKCQYLEVFFLITEDQIEQLN